MLHKFKEYINKNTISEKSGVLSYTDYMSEAAINEMALFQKVAYSAALIASLATSCRKPIDAEPEISNKNTTSIVKDTIKTNPIDTISYNPKDTTSTTPKDTTTHNVRNDVYGNWICTTICEANPTYQPDKISLSQDVLTWYIWGKTLASGGSQLGYNSVSYYNMNMLSSINQNDESKIRLFDYDKATNKIKFYIRVQGGELIPNKGYIPETNHEVAELRFDKNSQKLFYDNHIYNPIP